MTITTLLALVVARYQWHWNPIAVAAAGVLFLTIDLSFFAGPSFDFGGRVHTNGNLFLSQGVAATLTLRDRVTAVKEVIRP